MNNIARYFLNIALAVDRLGNTIAGGASQETISSRLGRIKEANNGVIPWHRPIAKVIDAGLDCLQRRHSLRSIDRNSINDIMDDSIIDGRVDLPKCGMKCEYVFTDKCKNCEFNK